MALIPSFFPDCVVAIGTDNNLQNRMWIASGFLYGYPTKKDEKGENMYSVYLITNRHVLENQAKIYLRFNPKANETAREYTIELLNDEKPIWTSHPNNKIDIAVIPINFNLLYEQGIQAAFFHCDKHGANISKLNELGIIEGDFVYVMGFPMGLVGQRRNTVIIRSGVIARIRDSLEKDNEEFLIDCFVFPGNSGGPVISKPEALSIQGTKAQTVAYLIGIVRGYISYREEAISPQSGRSRVIFEENSGLASVHPVEFIEETIDYHIKNQASEKKE